MKRKIAPRKLKRQCTQCNKSFKKGEVYYLQRNVVGFEKTVYAFEYLYCPKCNYQNRDSAKRFEEYRKNCKHPISDEVWKPIFGEEWRMEPSHTECTICGEII